MSAFSEWKKAYPTLYENWKTTNFPTQEELEELWWVIENMSTTNWVVDTNKTPTEILLEIMNYECQIALDPAVSKKARDLIQRGKEEKLLEILAPEELEKND